DGALDMLVSNYYSHDVSVFINDGSGTFTAGQTLDVHGYPSSSPTLADLNGDGALDILISNSDGGAVSIRMNDGMGNFSAGATLSPGGYSETYASPVLGDLNGDGVLDLVQSYSSEDSLGIFLL